MAERELTKDLLCFFPESLRTVFTEVYSKIRKHSLNNFWYDALETTEWWDLIDEKKFIQTKKPPDASPPSSSTKPPVQQAALPPAKSKSETTISECNTTSANVAERSVDKSDKITIESDDSDCELFASDDSVAGTKTKGKGFKLKLDPSDRELFCTGLTLGTQDYIGQRVLQIAQILRNLSFTDDNIVVLSRNRTFFRFLLLCVGSRWNSIQQLGLDMLSNIASDLIVKDQKDRLVECLMNFVTNGLHAEDRVIVIACLETLNKISQNELNEDFLLRTLEKKTYAQVCSFLTLHDVMLLIYTLECLYSLSSLGERACNFIVEIHGIIDTLVSLVTVEGKSYGPKACIGMKLVETVSGGPNPTSTAVTIQSSQPLQQTTTNTITTTPARLLTAPTPLRTITTPQKVIPTPVVTPLVTAPMLAPQPQPVVAQPSIQQQHAHQQAIQENEQFALAYLRATYEPCINGRIEQQELYKQYLNACAKIGRRGVIAPLHFPRCVR